MAIQTLSMFNQAFAITRLDIITNFFMVLLASNVDSVTYILARYLVYAFIVTTQAFYLITLTYMLTGFLPTPIDILLIIIFLIIGLTIWFNLGTICGFYIKNELTRDIIMMLVTTPSIFASSSLYTLENAPLPLIIISYLNPLTYISDSVRNAYLQLNISLGEIMIMLSLTVITSLAVFTSIKRFTIK